MSPYIIAALLWIGSLFTLVAALGVLKYPDVFLRMHAAAKAGSVGAVATLLALAVYFDDPGVRVRAFLVMLIIFITAPIFGHLVGLAVHRTSAADRETLSTDELAATHRPDDEPASP